MATVNCTSDRLPWSRLSHFSILSGPGRGQLCLLASAG